MAGKKRTRRANGDKDKNGKSRRRKNGTGTLEKRGDKWIALYYIVVDGLRKRKARTIDTDLVREARTQAGQPTDGIAEPITAEDARTVLGYLSEGGGKITREMMLKRTQAELQSLQADREAAEKERAEAERQKAETEADARAVKIADAWPLYVASKKRPDSGARTLDGYRAQYEVFAAWCAKNQPDTPKMRDFTPEMAEAFIDHLEKTRSRRTRNGYLIFLRTFWRVLRWNPDAQLSVDPWDGIKSIVQTPDEVKHKELTVDELTRVAHALISPETNALMSLTITPLDGRKNPFEVDIRGELTALFAIGIYTGLRLGDCACLDWGDIHFEKNIIDTMPRKTARKYGRRVMIPIHPALFALLTRIPSPKRIGRVLPNLADLYERNSAELTKRIQAVYRAAGIDTGSKGARLYMKRGFYRIEYAERNPDGTHIIEKTPYTDIEKARAYFAEKIGTAQRARAEVGFHSLRHTFASIMLNAGAPFAHVEKMLGHAQESMTAHYYHENAAALAAAVATLPTIPMLTGDAEAAADAPAVTPLISDGQSAAPTADAPQGRLDALYDLAKDLTADELQRAITYLTDLKSRSENATLPNIL